MDVQLAEQQLLVIPDRVTPEEAETRACAKRADAFGTMAKLSGFLNRGKDGDTIELVYKERRLQPFWRLACTAVCAFERTRNHTLVLGEEVQAATVCELSLTVDGGRLAIPVHETCRQESSRTVFYDALTGQETPALAALLDLGPQPATADTLAGETEGGSVVVPPTVRASSLTRELVAGMIGRIEADTIQEERVEVRTLELIYRPVHAFRFRRGDKQGVVEVDGLTGAVRSDGSTFEHLMGRVMEPAFLVDVGVEAINLFVPGARLAQIMVSKGVATHKALSTKR